MKNISKAEEYAQMHPINDCDVTSLLAGIELLFDY